MTQTWHDLLFAHWPVKPEVLRPLVPTRFPLDVFDNQCWVGIVPFHMSHIRRRGMPPVPGLSRFPELNLRTYVTLDGKPGVYFFSLDAASRAAVWAARRFYHLPYFYSHMSASFEGERLIYKSVRADRSAEFRGSYRPIAPVQLPPSESLEHWLTERYCLYTSIQDRPCRAEVHHQQWPLQAAEAEIEANTIAAAAGITLPAHAPLVQFSRKLEVLVWPLRRCAH